MANEYDITGVLIHRDNTRFDKSTDDHNSNVFGGMPIAENNLTTAKYRGLVSDIGNSGQMSGMGPRIMNLDGATPQIFPPAVIIMLQTPTMWRSVNNNIIGRTLRDLWELHSRSISGIDFGYTLNTSDSLIGQDGQNISMPTNTTRTPVSPSVTWTELYGNIVWNLHYRWIMDINHPDTQSSYLSAIKAATSPTNDDYLAELPPWVFSTFSCSFMAIQPDPYGTYDRILDAALYTACFPTETGTLGIKREVNVHEQMERTIPYKAIVQHNDNTREVGAMIFKSLNYHHPDLQRATTLATMDGTLKDAGYSKQAYDTITSFKDMVTDNYVLREEGSQAIANAMRNNFSDTVGMKDGSTLNVG